MPGPSRGPSEETEGEEGYDVSCEEISERWDFLKLLFFFIILFFLVILFI